MMDFSGAILVVRHEMYVGFVMLHFTVQTSPVQQVACGPDTALSTFSSPHKDEKYQTDLSV